MNYEDLLLALEADDEEVMRMYLREKILNPCLNGDHRCEAEYYLNDLIDADPRFVKSNLLNIYSFVVLEMGEMAHEVYVRAQCIDTVSAVKDGAFVKTRVVVAVNGEISPTLSTFDAEIYTNPIEEV